MRRFQNRVRLKSVFVEDKMYKKSMYTIMGLLVIFSMLLTACGAKETAVETPLATDAPVAEAPAAELPDTFIFGRGADSVQLDPAIVTDGESFRVTGQVLEPLYQYEMGSTVPVPALAEGCVPNADATVWDCKLREGVKFHDGTDFNADAVVFNYERWRFTTNPYHFASQVFEYYEAMWGGFDDASIITAIKAAGESYGTPTGGCVGTGPFIFVSWEEGNEIIVDANQSYWGGAPKIKQIVFRVIPDDSARFLALKAGDIHGLEQAVVEDLEAAEADPNLYILTRPALNTSYLAFNYKIKEFQDIKVREAVAHAIDKEGLISNFFGKYGSVAKNLLPPLVWGYNDAIEDWTYDPELSRQLLAEAGFPDGLSEVTVAEDVTDAEGTVLFKAGDKIPLRLYYMPVTRFYFPSAKEVGEGIAANLTAAGFNVELYLEGDWPTYLGSRRNGTLMGFYLLGWGGDNGDPDNFTGYFFGSGQEPIKREGWYQNAALADLLYTALVTPDRAAREALYKQAEQMMHDDVARIWLGNNNTPLIFSKAVKGYGPQPVGADYFEFIEFVQ
jgi:peptide/nickel transport system substrate-binding protein